MGLNDIIVKATGLSIGYRLGGGKKKQVHKGLDFDLRRGELTCLLGPNGAGKSTLLKTISATLPPLDGALRIEGIELNAYKEKDISRKIGLVLTDKTMAGGLTVFDLVALGRHPHTGFFGRLKERDCDAVWQALEAVGITHKSDDYVAQLSDGERQKVMIAKVIAQECPILLLDEPTAFLDVVSRIEIMNLLRRLAVEQKKTILLSTHDLEQALLLGDRLWLLSRENGLKCGITEDLVFSGDMDRFFARNQILFDKLSGSFRMASSRGIPVYVEAEGELLFWVNNLLIRNGFRIEHTKEKVFMTLQVVDKQEFWVSLADKKVSTLNSFAELNAFLKNILVNDSSIGK